MCRHNFNIDKGPISIEWFCGAETNIAYNCLDRHVEAGKGDKIAMYWEGNDLVRAPLPAEPLIEACVSVVLIHKSSFLD